MLAFLRVRLERGQEFLEVVRDDRSLSIRSGRVGTEGTSRQVACHDVHAAQSGHDGEIARALEQGFVALDAVSPSGLDVRNAELETALHDHRGDRDALLVYADWLQAAGNPIGELIALAVRAGAGRPDPAIDDRIDTLRVVLQPPRPIGVTYRFGAGLFEALRIANHTARPAKFLRALPELFAHVMCAALDDLTIAGLEPPRIGGPPPDPTLVPEVIDLAGRHPWARGLRRLQLGADGPTLSTTRLDSSHFDAGEIGARISNVFPRLERLRVRATSSSLAGLHLANLRELVLVAGWFGDRRHDELATMIVPALERLELWLGASPAAAPAVPARIAGLFDDGRLATVRDLALCNSYHADAFASVMPSWPITSRLRTLDLSWGTLSDDGARSLLVAPRRLAALEHLVVDGCYLSDEMVAALAARFPRVSAADQRPATTANQRVVAFLHV